MKKEMGNSALAQNPEKEQVGCSLWPGGFSGSVNIFVHAGWYKFTYLFFLKENDSGLVLYVMLEKNFQSAGCR